MINIFMAGTGTEVGKTTIVAALGAGWAKKGMRVGYWKPVSSGLPRRRRGSAGACLATNGLSFLFCLRYPSFSSRCGRKGKKTSRKFTDPGYKTE